MNFKKKIWLLIGISTLLRLLVAGSLELGNDEVYYQTYAQQLQWNYFDHPPMIALLIRLSTFNLFFSQEIFIRLGSVICAAGGTWLMFVIGTRIQNPQTGWIAAVLYNTSFYTSIIAGTFILPDSPEVIFWLAAIYLMIRILELPPDQGRMHIHFLLLGISIGCCIMSKLHGIFLWLGFGAYIIFYRRDLLKIPMLWVSALISIALISPIYFWNLQNHFITYTYHQGRVGFWGSHPDMDHLLQQVLGSVFYNNPVNFTLYIFTLIAIAKNKIIPFPKVYPLFLWLSLPLILLLIWTSLFNETLPHWSGPAYLSLMLLAGCWLDKIKNPSTKTRWLKSAGWLYISVLVIGVLGIRFLPFRLGSTDEKKLGTGDITLDMSGWRDFSKRMDSLYTADGNSGKMKREAFLVSDYWFPAGHLDHYCAIPYQHNLVAMGNLNNIHQFAWLNHRRPRLQKGSDIYFIYPSNYYGPPAAGLRNQFVQVDDSLVIPQYRSGTRVRNFIVYRMHDYTGDSLDYLIPGIQ